MIYETSCPCCGEKIEIDIQLDGSGNPTAFLVNSNIYSPTISELEELGIELGTEEVNNEK